MAWSTPLTAVSNTTLTAAQFNASVRDNLNATEVAKAANESGYFISTGANAIAQRFARTSGTANLQTTTSTSYVSSPDGPAVTASTGTRALVMFNCQIKNSTNAFCAASVAVSGATTVAASDDWCIAIDGTASGNNNRQGVWHMFDGLTTGSNTFEMQYRVSSGTATFDDRHLIVFPL